MYAIHCTCIGMWLISFPNGTQEVGTKYANVLLLSHLCGRLNGNHLYTRLLKLILLVAMTPVHLAPTNLICVNEQISFVSNTQ